MAKGKELNSQECWKNFKMVNDKLELPTGQQITPQELLTSVALLSIQSQLEITTTSKLLKYAREIARLNNLK